MNKRVLLTVAGDIPDDVAGKAARGERPTPDYLALAHHFDADLLDYGGARRIVGRLAPALERLGGADLVLAYACFAQRARYDVIFTDGEQVGLPFAALLKARGGTRPKHLMITHIISVPKKMFFLDRLGVQSQIDTFLVYASVQRDFLMQRWGLPASQVVFTPFMVDTQFFSAAHVTTAARARPLICAVGLERRDYPTLIEAVRDLDADVVIAAASPWAKQADTTEGQQIPANVTIQKFTQYDLRQLYADSSFLVMPLFDVEFQAGVTAILEAMAMERTVICSRTRGQTDVIIDGQNGLYVPPGNVAALRAAINRLLADPQLAADLGRAGRQLMDDEMSLDRYIVRLGSYVGRALQEKEH